MKSREAMIVTVIVALAVCFLIAIIIGAEGPTVDLMDRADPTE